MSSSSCRSFLLAGTWPCLENGPVKLLGRFILANEGQGLRAGTDQTSCLVVPKISVHDFTGFQAEDWQIYAWARCAFHNPGRLDRKRRMCPDDKFIAQNLR